MTARLVAFGGYDIRKPRVRLLLAALRRADGLADDIYIPAWADVSESNVPSRLNVLIVLIKIALGYPGALWHLWRAPKGAGVLLPYPGIIEILILAPFARLMGRSIVLDAFLPIYDTIIGDRAFVKKGLVSGAIWWFERLALGRADIILTDTDSHAEYFSQEFGLPRERFVTVLVGAEEQFALPGAGEEFDDASDLLGPADGVPIILFYGQLIPLHGLPTILEAAREAGDLDARWVVVGKGQLEPLLREELAREDANVEWIEWVDYERLPALIGRASLCLGVFGRSDKASRVIPNKLFQQAACGKPVITRKSPAIDDLARRFPSCIRTVEPGDPVALAQAVREGVSAKAGLQALPPEAIKALSPDAGVAELLGRLGSRAH